MKVKNIVSAIVMVAVITGAWVAQACDEHEKKGAALDLVNYYSIRAALAADKFEAVKESAEKVAKSKDSAVSKAGELLVAAKEISSARGAFADLTKALIQEVDSALKKGEKLEPVYVFNCPMAKPYGTWLQEKNEIGNPYYGASMLKCGSLVETKGATAEAKSKATDSKCTDGCCKE